MIRILGSDNARDDRGSLQQPLNSVVHPVKIEGDTYNLHDTVGLGAHNDAAKAMRKLYRLLDDLSNAGGINLLIYVVKCDKRPVETMRKTYSLIHHGFCDSKVPIVIVATGCENMEPTMDQWWTDHKAPFKAAGMSFEGHACVCTIQGTKTGDGGYRFQDLVEKSESEVTELILRHCNPNGWKKVSTVSTIPEALNLLKYFPLRNRLTRRNPTW